MQTHGEPLGPGAEVDGVILPGALGTGTETKVAAHISRYRRISIVIMTRQAEEDALKVDVANATPPDTFPGATQGSAFDTAVRTAVPAG